MRKILAVALVALATPSAASAYTAESLLHGINNIVLNDLDASAETQGTVYVGNNYNGSGGNVNPDGMPDFDLGSGIAGSLVVGGDINAVVNLNNGSAQIGGAVNGTLNNNGSGAMQVGVAGIPTADITSLLQNLSTDLASNPDTPGGTANTTDPNNVNFVSGSGDANGIQFFNISGSVLAGGTLTGITAPAGVTTIVNVGGTGPTIGINANQLGPDVLVNFYEASTLTINTAFNYSILAPFANVVQNGGGIFGTLVSYNLDQNAEVRPYAATTIPYGGILPAQQVPAPAGLALILGGLAGITVLARRKA
ncbi:MAG: choice-of-anchor A family protein [Alphaproteobacteria bacterium]|nr:choice-of-anchor A family protein [Alphaproteobacteria bacterium]